MLTSRGGEHFVFHQVMEKHTLGEVGNFVAYFIPHYRLSNFLRKNEGFIFLPDDVNCCCICLKH